MLLNLTKMLFAMENPLPCYPCKKLSLCFVYIGTLAPGSGELKIKIKSMK